MLIKDIKIPPILDESGYLNLFNQIKQTWVDPELEKRKQAGKIKDGFTVEKILIKMPRDKPAIIQFNNECGWIAHVQKDHDSSFQKNDPVYIHQIIKIIDVMRPKIDDSPVAFIFLHMVKGMWRISFDFLPSHEDWNEFEKHWPLGKIIANSLQQDIEEKIIMITPAANNLLAEVGLWGSPALIPYPLSKIIKQLSENDKIGAIKTLEEVCNLEFIEKLSVDWFDNQVFTKRKKIIQEALAGHKQELYTLTISALLPQIEGIVTDWIIIKNPGEEIPWRQESKTKKFQDLAIEGMTSVTYNIIVNSTINFILNGPVLETFKTWIEKTNDAFPNRHVVEHGKYTDSLFTKANSIKLFLLLDALYHIISEN